MISSSKKVENLVDTQIDELKKNAQLLDERCNRWTSYKKDIYSRIQCKLIPLSPSEIDEIRQKHTEEGLTVDALSYLQSIQTKLEKNISEQGGNPALELDSHRKDVAKRNAYKTDLDKWLSDNKLRHEQALESIDKELQFVENFCRRNNISLVEDEES